MGKHKKTRKEKIIADYRHQVYVLKEKSGTESVLNKNMFFDNPTLPIEIRENSYSKVYILKDVLKTGILTCSIVAAQIILFFLLKRHIITLPMLKY